MQSAYKKFHSTETALIKVHNDIATAIDDGHSVILVLSDLSAAFDTVDHGILLTRLSMRYGIRDRALEWFVSYLSDRTQFVKLDGSSSQSIHLPQGVPQGSVLGPILYSLYTSPLSDIANQHGMNVIFTLMIRSSTFLLKLAVLMTWNPLSLKWKRVFVTLTYGCFVIV